MKTELVNFGEVISRSLSQWLWAMNGRVVILMPSYDCWHGLKSRLGLVKIDSKLHPFGWDTVLRPQIWVKLSIAAAIV